MSTFENTLAFAQAQDSADPLRVFRDEFLFPQKDGRPVIYFTGNSLGLQPKGAAAALKQELDDWAALGVEGHYGACLLYTSMFAPSMYTRPPLS